MGIDLGVGGGPGGHSGGVAGDDIAVLIDQLARNGVTALGGQHIVQCLMCAVADSEVVIARIEDVALCAVGVIGREEVAGHIDRDSLGCTCGHIDFVIAQQLDRGLFDIVLLVVVGVGGLCVQLHRSLAVPVAGIAHRDGRREGVGVAVVVQLVKAVLIGRVGQTVAEGEADLLGVVPAVGRGLGANRGIGVALTEDGVLVAGLVVAVADIDAFVIADKAVACRAGRFAAVVVGVQTEVFGAGRGQGVGGKGGGGVTGGVDLTGHNADGAGHTVEAGVADPQHSVNIVLIQPVHLHRKDGVQQDDGFLEFAGILDFLEDRLLVVVQLQHTLALVVDHRKVVALGGKAGQRNKRDIAVGRKRVGDAAGEQRRVIFAHAGNASCFRRFGGSVGVQHGLVHVEAGILQGVNGGFLVIRVRGGTACGAAEHRVDAAAAKDRDVALRLGKRQGVVAVVEQHAALFLLLLTELISGFDVLFVACIRQGAISGELRAAVRCASAFDAECMVDFAFLLERNSRSGQDKVGHQHSRAGQAQPTAGLA